MARVPRIHRPGERHHVTNRTSRDFPAFLDDADRKFFLWLLSELYERFKVEIEAFCLMTNHYHIVAEADLEQLARALHRVGFLYTQYFNNRHELRGPLFSDRFFSSPVNDPEYHANAVRYIHRNPLAIDDEMDLASYEWSSHGAYLGLRPTHWLGTRPTLELFDNSVEQFRDFVEDDKHDLWIPSLTDIQKTVARMYFASPGEVIEYEPRRPNLGLQMVFLLASELLGTPTTALAKLAGLSETTARRLLKRAQSARSENADFSYLFGQAVTDIGRVPELPAWWENSWQL